MGRLSDEVKSRWPEDSRSGASVLAPGWSCKAYHSRIPGADGASSGRSPKMTGPRPVMRTGSACCPGAIASPDEARPYAGASKILTLPTGACGKMVAVASLRSWNVTSAGLLSLLAAACDGAALKDGAGTKEEGRDASVAGGRGSAGT